MGRWIRAVWGAAAVTMLGVALALRPADVTNATMTRTVTVTSTLTKTTTMTKDPDEPIGESGKRTEKGKGESTDGCGRDGEGSGGEVTTSCHVDEPEERLWPEVDVEAAAEYGLRMMNERYSVMEPELYRKGLWLDANSPARRVAAFGAPSPEARQVARYGYAALQATVKLLEQSSSDASVRTTPAQLQQSVRSTALHDQCPLRGEPRCPPASRRYRTADATCNNVKHPWRGAAMTPMQRFLPPIYQDGVQSVRRSVKDSLPLPSARLISTSIHHDKDVEMPTVTLMLMQWGQFVDHDLVAAVQSRGFQGSIPRCCRNGGRDFQPPEMMHPDCLPIPIPENDIFFGPKNIKCMEFLRSAPASRIDCDLGWREQINQVTSFLDASQIYGSSARVADTTRLFKKGLMKYGRDETNRPLQPPDPPGAELCRKGAISSDCFEAGDGRVNEQPALTAMHIMWIRKHNLLAEQLSDLNPQWSDEKIYQESRRIVGALIQHITYREFLPIVVGQEVMRLFDLALLPKGYYAKYEEKINPAPANGFATAAYRFGHSLVQKSFVRSNRDHKPVFNNVSLHEEQTNPSNIWNFGSVDKLILGLCNQASQRRDEFISDELTNHLFQTQGFGFGMDLGAINIQRGRDHGIPPYVEWRSPCGLSTIKNWDDLKKVMSNTTAEKFRTIYEDVQDIDLFSGGLAERPVRGGLVGPTFACIIAQQFSNLRRGDRFWYENGDSESSFTPSQLAQIRKVTLSQIICHTMEHIESVQQFVFLSADNFRNMRVSCLSNKMDNFDLGFWLEKGRNIEGDELGIDLGNIEDRTVKRKATTKAPVVRKGTTTRKPTTKRTLHLSTKPRITTRRPMKTTTKKYSSVRPGQIVVNNIKYTKNSTTGLNEVIETQIVIHSGNETTNKTKPSIENKNYYGINIIHDQHQYHYTVTTPTHWTHSYESTPRPQVSMNPYFDDMTKRKTTKPPEDVTYLVGLVRPSTGIKRFTTVPKAPETVTPKPNYQFNIHINYQVPTTNKMYDTTSKKSYYHYETTTRRPTTAMNRPYYEDVGSFNRPKPVNNYGSFDDSLAKPSRPPYTYSYANDRFSSTTKRYFVMTRPSNYYDNVQSDSFPSTTSRPSISYPTVNPNIYMTTRRPTVQDDYPVYQTTSRPKPYIRPNTQSSYGSSFSRPNKYEYVQSDSLAMSIKPKPQQPSTHFSSSYGIVLSDPGATQRPRPPSVYVMLDDQSVVPVTPKPMLQPSYQTPSYHDAPYIYHRPISTTARPATITSSYIMIQNDGARPTRPPYHYPNRPENTQVLRPSTAQPYEDGYYSGSAKPTRRPPFWQLNRPDAVDTQVIVVNDPIYETYDQIQEIYGQILNAELGPISQNDPPNNPNFGYDDSIYYKAEHKDQKDKEEPQKLLYINNVLHKVKKTEADASSTTKAPETADKTTKKLVQITAVKGYHKSNTRAAI